MHNGDIEVEKTKSYSEEDTGYREFLVKLQFVKEKMLTARGKEIAEGRHKFMVEFFDRINKEANAQI